MPLQAKHVRAFAVSNGISLLSVLPALYLSSKGRLAKSSSLLVWYLLSVFKLGFVAVVLDHFTRNQREFKHLDGDDSSSSSLRAAVRGLLFVTSPLEAIMSKIGYEHFTSRSPSSSSSFSSLLSFIPLTFVFEVVFDCGHYWAHRLVHQYAWLYRVSGHKTHHQVLHPSAFSTYHQELVDSLLSNVLPFFAALVFMDRVGGWRFTPTQLLVASGLKTYVEVAGHVGVLDSHATSFPQCVWLPRALGIALQTKDHDLHHSNGGRTNFAKRFTLFDKLFGTYQKPPPAQMRGDADE